MKRLYLYAWQLQAAKSSDSRHPLEASLENDLRWAE